MLTLLKKAFDLITDFLLKLANGGIIEIKRQGESSETEKHNNSIKINGKAFVVLQLLIIGIVVIGMIVLRHFGI